MLKRFREPARFQAPTMPARIRGDTSIIKAITGGETETSGLGGKRRAPFSRQSDSGRHIQPSTREVSARRAQLFQAAVLFRPEPSPLRRHVACIKRNESHRPPVFLWADWKPDRARLQPGRRSHAKKLEHCSPIVRIEKPRAKRKRRRFR
jgi:hypothetical protein